MTDTIKVTQKIINQCNVLKELESNINEYRPSLLNGFFYTSNADAFRFAEEVKTGALKNLSASQVEILNQGLEDILSICGSSRISIKSLQDMGVTLREILDDIEAYDNA